MRIIVGYDASNAARRAVLLAQEHGKFLGAKVEVISVVHQNNNLGYDEIQKAEADLAKDIRNLFKNNTIPFKEYLVVSNLSPGEELVEFAERDKVDEIIIGVRKKSRVGKFLLGSTAQYTVLNAPCPVVTVNKNNLQPDTE
jgi:nucleotide-binding universal stress UspA family protein